MQKIRTDEMQLRFLRAACGSNASSISRARASKIWRRFLWRPSKFSSTSANCCSAASGSSAQNSSDNSIGASLVGGVEVLRLNRRFEGSHNDPGGVWPQIQSLSIQEHSLRQTSTLRAFVARAGQTFRRSEANSGGGWRVLPPRQRVRTDASRQDREGRKLPTPHLYSHLDDRGEARPGNLHHWARPAMSEGRCRPETNRMHALLLLSTPRRCRASMPQGMLKSLRLPRLVVDQTLVAPFA